MVFEWEVKTVPIEQIKRADYNPRMVNPLGATSYKKSRELYGPVEPIVLNNDLTIIGGHQRFSIELGEGSKTVEAMVSLSLLDKKQEQELNILLNSGAGETDEGMLRQFGITQDILEETGFRDFRLYDFEEIDNNKETDTKTKKVGNRMRLVYPPSEAVDIRQRLGRIGAELGIDDVTDVFIHLYKEYVNLGN